MSRSHSYSVKHELYITLRQPLPMSQTHTLNVSSVWVGEILIDLHVLIRSDLECFWHLGWQNVQMRAENITHLLDSFRHNSQSRSAEIFKEYSTGLTFKIIIIIIKYTNPVYRHSGLLHAKVSGPSFGAIDPCSMYTLTLKVNRNLNSEIWNLKP